MVDSYSQVLIDVIASLESIYRIDQITAEHGSNISKIMSQVSAEITQIPAGEKAARNTEAGKQVVILSYLCFRMGFYGVSRMDFSPFYNMQEVVDIIQLFSTKGGFTKANTNKLNRIIKILDISDSESSNARHGLAYKYIRIFIIMIVYGVSCNACVLANLICQQAVAQNKIQNKS